MAQFDSSFSQDGSQYSDTKPERSPDEIAQVIPRQLLKSLTPSQSHESRGKTVGFKITWPDMLKEEESTTDPEIWNFAKEIGGSHIAFAVADFDTEGHMTGYDIIHLYAEWREMGTKNQQGIEVYTVVGAPLEARLNRVHPEREFKRVEPIGIIDRGKYPTNEDLMNLSRLHS
jgi:hypothetical protein